MSEEEIQRSLGRIEGTVESLVKSVVNIDEVMRDISAAQSGTIARLDSGAKKIDTLEDDVKVLKATKNRLLGMGVLFAVVVGTLGKSAAWILTKIGVLL